MTNSMSHSDRRRFESSFWFDSQAAQGVRVRVRRISVAGRIELARKIRDIAKRIEFLDAGDAREKAEAAVLAGEIDRAYLEWGVEGIEGLMLDDEPATPQSLVERGPLDLALEVVARIKAECTLSEAERKN